MSDWKSARSVALPLGLHLVGPFKELKVSDGHAEGAHSPSAGPGKGPRGYSPLTIRRN